MIEYIHSTNFPRIRVGVGRPEDNSDPVNYLLQNRGCYN
ncbi:MAG: hypothetical protein R3264_14385 [Anaerolineae bacterium]|nr:hypothetical protein [Anaerolineae bacterium]